MTPPTDVCPHCGQSTTLIGRLADTVNDGIYAAVVIIGLAIALVAAVRWLDRRMFGLVVLLAVLVAGCAADVAPTAPTPQGPTAPAVVPATPPAPLVYTVRLQPESALTRWLLPIPAPENQHVAIFYSGTVAVGAIGPTPHAVPTAVTVDCGGGTGGATYRPGVLGTVAFSCRFAAVGRYPVTAQVVAPDGQVVTDTRVLEVVRP